MKQKEEQRLFFYIKKQEIINFSFYYGLIILISSIFLVISIYREKGINLVDTRQQIDFIIENQISKPISALQQVYVNQNCPLGFEQLSLGIYSGITTGCLCGKTFYSLPPESENCNDFVEQDCQIIQQVVERNLKVFDNKYICAKFTQNFFVINNENECPNNFRKCLRYFCVDQNEECPISHYKQYTYEHKKEQKKRINFNHENLNQNPSKQNKADSIPIPKNQLYLKDKKIMEFSYLPDVNDLLFKIKISNNKQPCLDSKLDIIAFNQQGTPKLEIKQCKQMNINQAFLVGQQDINSFLHNNQINTGKIDFTTSTEENDSSANLFTILRLKLNSAPTCLKYSFQDLIQEYNKTQIRQNVCITLFILIILLSLVLIIGSHMQIIVKEPNHLIILSIIIMFFLLINSLFFSPSPRQEAIEQFQEFLRLQCYIQKEIIQDLHILSHLFDNLFYISQVMFYIFLIFSMGFIAILLCLYYTYYQQFNFPIKKISSDKKENQSEQQIISLNASQVNTSRKLLEEIQQIEVQEDPLQFQSLEIQLKQQLNENQFQENNQIVMEQQSTDGFQAYSRQMHLNIQEQAEKNHVVLLFSYLSQKIQLNNNNKSVFLSQIQSQNQPTQLHLSYDPIQNIQQSPNIQQAKVKIYNLYLACNQITQMYSQYKQGTEEQEFFKHAINIKSHNFVIYAINKYFRRCQQMNIFNLPQLNSITYGLRLLSLYMTQQEITVFRIYLTIPQQSNHTQRSLKDQEFKQLMLNIKDQLAKQIGLENNQIKYFLQSFPTSNAGSFINELKQQEKNQMIIDFVPEDTPLIRFDQNKKKIFLKQITNLFLELNQQLQIDLKLYNFLPIILLQRLDFTQKYDQIWVEPVNKSGNQNQNENNKQNEKIYRGEIRGKKFPYYQPIGFYGFGLRVQGLYEEDDWLQRDNKEWIVLYYPMHSLDGLKEPPFTRMRVPQNIQEAMTGQVFWEYLKKYPIQQSFVTQSTNQKRNSLESNYNSFCGPGAYFAHKAKNAISHCNLVRIGFSQYVILMQCKVRASAVIQIQDVPPDYFIVRNASDIRPYRLLIKEIKSNVLDLININNLERETIQEDEFQNCNILLGKDGAFHDFSILIGLFCKQEGKKSDLVKMIGPQFKRLGFKVKIVETLEEFINDLKQANQAWIFSGFEHFFKQQLFLQGVKDFMMQKKSLYLFVKGGDYNQQANLIFKNFFQDMIVEQFYEGLDMITRKNIISACCFNSKHPIAFGLNQFFEGNCQGILKNIHEDFQVFAYNKIQQPTILYASENDWHGKIILDCDFSKLFPSKNQWQMTGIAQYVANAAAWLSVSEI